VPDLHRLADPQRLAAIGSGSPSFTLRTSATSVGLKSRIGVTLRR
jgi:hypothetical protein